MKSDICLVHKTGKYNQSIVNSCCNEFYELLRKNVLGM